MSLLQVKCNSCWVEFLTGWFHHVNSSIGCVIATRGLATTKTTPKRSTYENKNHQCLHLKWSECFQQNWCLCSRLVSCISQIKLPQLVALTEVKGQVNAPVRVIMMTLQVWKNALLPKGTTYWMCMDVSSKPSVSCPPMSTGNGGSCKNFLVLNSRYTQSSKCLPHCSYKFQRS